MLQISEENSHGAGGPPANKKNSAKQWKGGYTLLIRGCSRTSIHKGGCASRRLHTGLAAAFRKAEMFLPSGSHFDFKRLSWASVVWFIRGKFVVIPTNAQLRGLAEGDAAVVKPGGSKTDPFGTYFSTQPIWLPVVFGDVL